MPAPAAVSADLVLVIDLGSSGAKLGVVRGEDVAGPVRLPRVDAGGIREFAGPLVKGARPIAAISGSDLSKAKDLAWELQKAGFPGAVVVGHDHPGLPKSPTRQPERGGVDRRVQALAASVLGAGPAVVVSAGTALVVDAASADGVLLGGAIAAGLSLSARALSVGAKNLPLVDLQGPVTAPAPDTETAVRLGVVVGAAGAVERLVEAIRPTPGCPVFLTGADAHALSPHLRIPHRMHGGLSLLGTALAVRRAPPVPGSGVIG